MRSSTKKAAAISALALGFALVGAGCQSSSDEADSTTTTVATETDVIEETTEVVVEETTTVIPGADGTEYEVSGVILEKWESLEESAQTDLGAPIDVVQTNDDGGVYQQFDGGVIISSDEGTYVVWGAIRDEWNELGGSQGDLGYPTSDETEDADGNKVSTFQNGTVTWNPNTSETTVELEEVTETETEVTVEEEPAPAG